VSKLTKHQVSEASAFAETFQICGRDWDTWHDEQLAKIIDAARQLEVKRSKPEVEEIQKDAAHMRMLLAVRCAPLPELYTDDGELQDNSEIPFIDFKRDTAAKIEAKLRQRAILKLREKNK
jgi:hypothetical protein